MSRAFTSSAVPSAMCSKGMLTAPVIAPANHVHGASARRAAVSSHLSGGSRPASLPLVTGEPWHRVFEYCRYRLPSQVSRRFGQLYLGAT